MRISRGLGLCAVALTTALVHQASADLLLYEPFDYTVGENLGGSGDPDGGGPDAGTPIGQSGNYEPGAGGGAYTWYARGTQSSYQSTRDTLISSGNLSYAGLATSAGNSASYGSEVGSLAVYANSIALPTPVTSASIYASFIIRIKSNVNSPTATTFRHSPAAFNADVSDAASAGSALTSQGGGNVPMGGFFMRRDPTIVGTTNFSPSKSSGDGIGPGGSAPGNNAGWQSSNLGTAVESNQFGDLDGQIAADFSTPASYQTYFVVLKYEFDAGSSNVNEYDAPGSTPTAVAQNDTVSLWMNPGAGTLGVTNGESLASQAASGNVGSYFAATDAYGGLTLDMSTIKSFTLIGHRQNTDTSIAVDFDELRIGTTWADVTPAASTEDADFDQDGDVDGADFLTWQRGIGGTPTLANGNANDDATIDGDDLAVWEGQFGTPAVAAGTAIPEPTGALLALAGLLVAAARRCSGPLPLVGRDQTSTVAGGDRAQVR